MCDTKTCTKCKETLAVTNFSKCGTKSDGTIRLNSWCNSCRTKQNRERLGVNKRPKPIVTDTHKECLHCNKLLPLKNFPDSIRGRKGKGTYCKSCNKERYYDKEKAKKYTKDYRERHKERWRAMHRVHQFNRKSLIKTASDGTVTDDFIKTLLNKETCCWCNKHVNIEDRTVEHIQELSQGGLHSASNLDMACKSCNSSRPNKNNNNKVINNE